MPDNDNCIHCKLPIPPEDLLIDTIDGVDLHFCCHGCRSVYRIITGAGLGNYYKQRDWADKGVPDGVFQHRFDETTLSSHVANSSETSAEISLIIEGIRCASCIWLLEKLVSREDGVEFIHINYGTHRARVRFNPKQTTPVQVFNAISRLGYFPHPYTFGEAQKAASREQRSLLIRFGTAAFLSMQLMGFSFALYGGYFHGIDPEIRSMIQYFAAAVTTPVIFYSGWPFLAGAWRSLKNHTPTMDLLISLGVMAAYIFSLYSMMTGGEVYFDTAAMIITLILLGRLFEGSARTRSVSGINKLLQLAPESADLVDGENVRTVASSTLVPGNIIQILPGGRIPVDGLILQGESEIDESMVTGEPLPVLRRQGEALSAGTLNMDSTLRLEVVNIAAESFVARMAQLVEQAQNRKAPIQSLADRVATLFVPMVTLTAFATWVFWYFSGGSQEQALLAAVSVLIVACPCALGLATPTAVLVASGSAASRGILFRGGDILELTAKIDLVAFDKTGTLTHGRPAVEKIITAPGQSENQLLYLAGQIESGSNHPIATGIKARARAEGMLDVASTSVRTIAGRGLKMISAKGVVLAGSRTFLQEQGVEVPTFDSGSLTEVFLSLNGNWQGALLMQDLLREEAAVAARRLKDLKIETVLLTGDHRQAAERVADKLCITSLHVNQSPTDKANWISAQQQSGLKVMMVGDGINDAPALSTADVGCAMAGGTDIALETSDLVLTRPDLLRVCDAILMARKTLQVIKQNLFWAFAYNMVTIPLAATGNLAPVWAAVAMASSSILVVGNSLRLGRLIQRTF